VLKHPGITQTNLEIVRSARFFSGLLGAATDLLRRILERTRPNKFYLDAIVVAAAWFIVIVMLVKTVEWLAKRQATSKPDKYETASLDKK
jgi:hypothetical protein